MTVFDHEALVRRFAKAMNTADRELMATAITPDYVTDWPQSGERVHGFDNLWAIVTNYPDAGGRVANDLDSVRTHPASGMKLMAPSFTFVAVEGAGNTGTFTLKVRYPDGSDWWVVSLYRLRDERMASATTFFAPVFPAPEWRAKWVERV